MSRGRYEETGPVEFYPAIVPAAPPMLDSIVPTFLSGPPTFQTLPPPMRKDGSRLVRFVTNTQQIEQGDFGLESFYHHTVIMS